MVKQRLIGYVFKYANGEKYYGQYYIEKNKDEIARFIMQNKDYRVVITDISDELFCTSLPGGLLDYVKDQNFLNDELLPTILEYQFGKKVDKIRFYESEPGVFLKK